MQTAHQADQVRVAGSGWHGSTSLRYMTWLQDWEVDHYNLGIRNPLNSTNIHTSSYSQSWHLHDHGPSRIFHPAQIPQATSLRGRTVSIEKLGPTRPRPPHAHDGDHPPKTSPDFRSRLTTEGSPADAVIQALRRIGGSLLRGPLMLPRVLPRCLRGTI